MIIVKLVGGIGNQMFQYAAGRRLAKFNNSELKLDITHYDQLILPNGLPYRSYDLSIFNIKESIANKKEIDLYKHNSNSISKRVIKKTINYFSPHIEKIESQFNFSPEILHLKGNIYLDGYWQSEKYFKDIEDVIRTDFQIKTTLKSEGADLLEKIQNTNSVCLNIRRQEFASNRYINQFAGEDYLNKAIELMVTKTNNPHFFIFSDELPWCKHHLKISREHTFVEEYLYGDRYRDCLFLMSSCKNFIIPNSTFGWWGAWLSTNLKKIVIAPEKWLNDPSKNTIDVIPKSWIKI